MSKSRTVNYEIEESECEYECWDDYYFIILRSKLNADDTELIKKARAHGQKAVSIILGTDHPAIKAFDNNIPDNQNHNIVVMSYNSLQVRGFYNVKRVEKKAHKHGYEIDKLNLSSPVRKKEHQEKEKSDKKADRRNWLVIAALLIGSIIGSGIIGPFTKYFIDSFIENKQPINLTTKKNQLCPKLNQ